MKTTIEMMRKLKCIKNSFYEDLKIEYLACSNRLTGSTFSEEQLERLMTERVVSGRHHLNDVYETKNSIDVFEMAMGSLGQKLDKEVLMSWLRVMKKGCYGSEISKETEDLLDDLLLDWEQSSKRIEDIVRFHVKFEHVIKYNRLSYIVVLKLCIEQELDIPMITEELEEEYKSSLLVALKHGDYSFMTEVFIKGQQKFDGRFSNYFSLINEL